MSDIEHDVIGSDAHRGASHRKRLISIDLIADERRRQVTKKGYTEEHDDRHDNGSLGLAAAAYAIPNGSFRVRREIVWPYAADEFHPSPDDVDGRLRELAKAGALVAAEIDRLLRWANAND